MRVRSILVTVALAVTSVVAFTSPAYAHPVLTVTASPTTVTAGGNVTVTISGKSNGNYSGARIEVFSTGGPGQLTTFTTLVGCTGGTISCTEITNRYKLGLPNLVTNQNFSYSVTFTVDAATAATTFTSKAQFYKSDNTTDGPTTGPVITVTHPVADLSLAKASFIARLDGELFYDVAITNPGPATPTDAVVTGTISGVAVQGGFPQDDAAVFFQERCTYGGSVSQCNSAGYPLPVGVDTLTFPFFISNDLFIGNFTFTVAITSGSDPNSANNTVTWNCTALTGLIINCA